MTSIEGSPRRSSSGSARRPAVAASAAARAGSASVHATRSDGGERRAAGDVVLRDVAAADRPTRAGRMAVSGPSGARRAGEAAPDRTRWTPTRRRSPARRHGRARRSATRRSGHRRAPRPRCRVHDAASHGAVHERVAAARARRERRAVLDVERADAGPEVADHVAGDAPPTSTQKMSTWKSTVRLGRVAEERVAGAGASTSCISPSWLWMPTRGRGVPRSPPRRRASPRSADVVASRTGARRR